ncbi:TPA: WavE lipopolysaccharide synthesis family protein [Photobacterium damselae]
MHDSLSFILQGAIDKTPFNNSYVTLELVKSIKLFYPDSEVILSIWDADDISEFLSFNNIKIIKNRDPGGLIFHNEKCNNYNRMLISSINGLKESITEYVVKMRTDMILTAPLPCIRKLNNSYPDYDYDYKIVDNRVAIISYSSVNPDFNKDKLLFHPCDWFFYGLRCDVIKFFDGKLLNNSEALFFYNKDNKQDYIAKYRSEQLLCLNLVSHSDIKIIKDAYDFNSELDIISKKIIANNFIILEAKKLSLFSLKHKGLSRITPKRINFITWLDWYYKYSSKIGKIGKIGKCKIKIFKIFIECFNIIYDLKVKIERKR